MDLAGRGEAGEAAIGAGDDVLLPDRTGKAADALGDQLGMLDDVRGMGDDPGNERLALGQFDALPNPPFVLVARVGGFERIGAGVDPQHDVDDVLQLHVVDARPDIDAVAGVVADALLWQAAQRVVERVDPYTRPFAAILDARFRVHHVIGGEERVVDLEDEPSAAAVLARDQSAAAEFPCGEPRRDGNRIRQTKNSKNVRYF